MSIVEAIERAKQMAQELEQAHAGVRKRNGVDKDRKAPERSAKPVPVLSSPIRSMRVEIDVSSCKSSRILFPGCLEPEQENVETAFRMLRTRLLQRARANGWTTIGITSACPNDGKTLTAINLALCLAREQNNDIVLLDMDMRNPSVCRALGIAPVNRILGYFEGRVPADDLFMSVGIERLLIAGGLQGSERSSELLSNNRFEELIDYIKGGTTKPLVLIDLPPVLSTDDALVLAPRLDAMLIVTSEGMTERAQLERTTALLSEFRIAGIVLNRSREAVQGYYGYRYK